MSERQPVTITSDDIVELPHFRQGQQWIKDMNAFRQEAFDNRVSFPPLLLPDSPIPTPPTPSVKIDHGAALVLPVPATIFEPPRKKPGKHPPLPKHALNKSNRIGARLVVKTGIMKLEETIGGLGGALRSYAKGRNGDDGDSHRDPTVSWTGWDGMTPSKTSPIVIEDSGEIFRRLSRKLPVKMNAISLDPDDVEAHYNVISNGWWWFFLQEHGRQLQDATFDLSAFPRHLAVNEKFALDAHEELKHKNGPVLFHDYHLMFAGEMLRKHRPNHKIGWFDHITWPHPDVLQLIHPAEQVKMEQVMPMVVNALLANNVVGFQTKKDRNNFVRWVEKYRPDADLKITENGILASAHDTGKTIIDAFPISVDADALEKLVSKTEIGPEVGALLEKYKRKIKLVCVGRLDPTKGFIQGINAIDALLDRHPEFRGKIVAIEVASPSREDVEAYQLLKEEFEQRVEEINERWAEYGQVIEYVPGLKHDQTMKLLSHADVAYVHSEVDGMNLVAKEAVVVGKHDMSLIIGKNAGAVEELGDYGYVVDVNNQDDMIYCLFAALNIPKDQHVTMKKHMKRIVREFNVHKWGNRLFSTIENFDYFVKLLEESESIPLTA